MRPSADVLAVVIGRAGSRGLPGKNALPVAGRPMVAWSVAHALACPEIDRVVVSTDGDEIADAARVAGADVIMRPAALATDTSSVIDAVRHAVASEAASAPSVVVILYANVPVRPAGLAGEAVRTLRAHAADSVQSYADVGKHHPAWMVRLEGPEGRVEPLQPDAPDRRQELPSLHLPDGGVIAVRSELLSAGPHPHAFLGTRRLGIVTPPGSVVDVDDAGDLARARALLEPDTPLGSPR
ncbi:MAG: NTP transferase domain-containing protein [Phycisphaerales bacterium]